MRALVYGLVVQCRPVTKHLGWPFLRASLELMGLAAVCYRLAGRQDVHDGIVKYLEEVS